MKENPRSSFSTGDFFVPEAVTARHSSIQTNIAEQAIRDLVTQASVRNRALSDALFYHFEAGGQRVRMAMALSVGSALNLSENTQLRLALAVELVHNASLIHDDIQDQDALRRGKPALWREFGTDLAILAGDYLLSAAYGQLAQADTQLAPLIKHLHDTVTDLIHGQAQDINANAHSGQIHSLEAYTEIVMAKSGALLALPIELALLAANRTESMAVARRAGECFAVGYQIADDLADLSNDTRHGCLNLIHGLLSSGDELAAQTATQIALTHCRKSITLARQLPEGCGAYLIDRAERMESDLAIVQTPSNR